MAIVVRELVTKLGFDVDEKGIKENEKRVQGFKKKAIGGLKKAALGIGVALAGIGVAAIKTAGDMETITTQFEVMLGSAEKAKTLIKDLRKFSVETPFELQDLAKGSQNLLAAGVASEKVVDTMKMLGDTAGGSTEKLNGLILGYSKMESTGKASLEVLNIFAERGVPIFAEMQKNLGLTKDEFFKMVSAGKISTKDVTKAFQTMTSEGGLFFQGMLKASTTFEGLMSTAVGAFKDVLITLGQEMLPTAKEILSVLIELAQGPLQDLAKSLGQVLAVVFKALGPILKEAIKFLVPILTFAAEILGRILTALLPLLQLLDPILEIVEALMPVIEFIVELIEFIVPIIIPLLKFAIKIISGIVKFAVFLVQIIRIIVKLIMWWLKLLWKVYSTIFKFILWPFKQLFKLIKQIAGFFKDVFINALMSVGDFFKSLWDTIAGSINNAIVAFNKLTPGNKFDIAGRLPTFAKAGGGTGTTMNANVKADTQVNVPPGSAGSPEQIGKAVSGAVNQALSFQLKKILVAAM
jgi:tape measure domain-containing protein